MLVALLGPQARRRRAGGGQSVYEVDAAALSPQTWRAEFLSKGIPVLLNLPCKHFPDWTLASLREHYGKTLVQVRRNTRSDEYKAGMRKWCFQAMTLDSYMSLLTSRRTKEQGCDYYLAVQNIKKVFPSLAASMSMLDLPGLGPLKLHAGPFLWVAAEKHYEYCHQDPDDNFLLVTEGVKRVRMFGPEWLAALYPNPLGARGRTIQSQVPLHRPFAEIVLDYPRFADAAPCMMEVEVRAGQMLFIPAFTWHQVSALQVTVSLNVFFGDADQGEEVDSEDSSAGLERIKQHHQQNKQNSYLSKICRVFKRDVKDGQQSSALQRHLAWLPGYLSSLSSRDPVAQLAGKLEEPLNAQWVACAFWLLNVIEQNIDCPSLPRIVQQLPESLAAFLLTQWHEVPSPSQLCLLVGLIRSYLTQRPRLFPGRAAPQLDADHLAQQPGPHNRPALAGEAAQRMDRLECWRENSPPPAAPRNAPRLKIRHLPDFEPPSKTTLPTPNSQNYDYR
eukprot:g73518.t1